MSDSEIEARLARIEKKIDRLHQAQSLHFGSHCVMESAVISILEGHGREQAAARIEKLAALFHGELEDEHIVQGVENAKRVVLQSLGVGGAPDMARISEMDSRLALLSRVVSWQAGQLDLCEDVIFATLPHLSASAIADVRARIEESTALSLGECENEIKHQAYAERSDIFLAKLTA